MFAVLSSARAKASAVLIHAWLQVSVEVGLYVAEGKAACRHALLCAGECMSDAFCIAG